MVSKRIGWDEMSQLQIKDFRNIDYTSVPNQFIDCYMADANDAQLKVYFYLLRHSKTDQDISISVLADYFNYTEKDILRALSYWEDKQILKLDYDQQGQPLQISLFALPSVTVHSPAQSKSIPSVLNTAPPSPPVKPDYSLEQLSAFKDRDSTSQLVFISESYLGKTLSAGDIRSLLFISDELNFSFDLVDYLLQYCVDRGKRDFRYIEKVALSWSEANIHTPAEAERQTSRYTKHIYTVMNALGKSNSPTPWEVEYITKWYQDYGFTIDIILEACERTVLGTDKRRFEYADKILSSWKKAGVHHKQDINRIDAYYASKKRSISSPPSPVVKNKFNQFQQNDYDFDALERELLSN